MATKSYHHGDLRAALLDAALEIIEENGPKGLTIRAVARLAGVSHAAPYRHFADKEEMILAVVERGFSILDQTMKQALAEAGTDPLQQFAASGQAYFSFALRYPAYYRVMFNGDLLNRDGQESVRFTSSTAIEQMKGTLLTCQELGIVRRGDPLLQAVFIISTVHGFVSLVNDNRISHLVGDQYSDEDIQAFVLNTMFEGLGAASPV